MNKFNSGTTNSKITQKTKGSPLNPLFGTIGIVAGLTMSNIEIFGGSKVKAAQQWVNSTGEAYVASYLTLVGEYPSL